jgi:hypothetical protein
VTINYIPTDVELLVSRTPFAQQAGGKFAFTRPAYSQGVKLPAGRDKVAIPVPDDLQRRNMLVEVRAAGKTRVATYFAVDMDVKLTENYGPVRPRLRRVAEARRPTARREVHAIPFNPSPGAAAPGRWAGSGFAHSTAVGRASSSHSGTGGVRR